MIIFFLFSLITVVSDTPDSLVIRYTAEYQKNKVGDKTQYNLKTGGSFPEETGFPALPSVRKKILTPANGKTELRYRVLSILNEREIPTIIQRYGEKEIKGIPKNYTPTPVTIIENRQSPHGNATIIINPFSFDGKNVKIRNNILIKIYFKGGNWISPRGYQRNNPLLFLNKIRGERIRTSSVQKLRQGAFLYAKIKTTKEGLYEITPADLREAGITPSSIDPEKIEVRGGYDKVMNWDMDSLTAMDTLLDILPAIYEIDEDGTFEEGEKILFYAHSLSGWERNKFNNYAFFYYHPYTDTNVYWLRFNGENPLEMEEISQSGGTNVSHFTDTIHLEEDVNTPLKSGLVWGWKELNTTGDVSGSSAARLQTAFNVLNNYNNQAIIQIAFYPKTAGTYDITVSLNGESVSKSVVSQGNEKKERTIFADTINTLNSGLNSLVITLETPENSIIMDYIEVIYEKRLVANENKLLITNDQLSIRNYSTSGFSSNPYVLNISDSRNPSLVSHSFSNGNANFSTDSRKILLQSSPYSIEGISLEDPTSLFQGGADWIVITDKQFVAPASRLKNWRDNHLRGIPSPQARVVEIDEIYDNFSYGVKDPSAIKRFLYWTQENWNPPVSYVLLFGDGNYDDKNLMGETGKTSFIPIHTEGTTVYETSLYLNANPCLDSWFVDFNEDRVQDIPIGRVTVSDIAEGTGWADKLIDYENSTGSWRMEVILLADDAIKSGHSISGERKHTTLMETLSSLLPDWIYRDKIYLMEYPMSGSGTKPEAKEAHLKSMSDGALLGFYLGHGNLTQITDEKVLEINDINFLSNWRKAPLYYFGSCDVGYFERPNQNCIGGKSNLYKDGGNIVSIAAGRATGYTENGELGQEISKYIFNDSVPAAGDAFLLAKQSKGDYTYTFFGDPATSIFIDSVIPGVTIPDTAEGGKQLKIEGSVENAADKIFCFITEARYDTILDAEEGMDSDSNGEPLPTIIRKEGKTIFRGSALMVDDSFSLKANIPYNIKSDSGIISLYSRGEKESYFSSQIYFVEGSIPEDTLPPNIEFKLNDRVLSRGDLIPPSGEIILTVKDSSGIDLRAKSNLQAIINNREPLFLADRFSYTTGSSTTGAVTFPYKALAFSDSIKFQIYAKDNAGNIANEKISLKIGKEELLWNVRNYPNPMKDKTVIVYHISEELSVTIKIFTIAGRLVKELSPGISRYGANYVEWDGRDRKRRKVSNGVYYYTIKAGDAEPYYGKIAVIR
jgi:hypothetical protein